MKQDLHKFQKFPGFELPRSSLNAWSVSAYSLRVSNLITISETWLPTLSFRVRTSCEAVDCCGRGENRRG